MIPLKIYAAVMGVLLAIYAIISLRVWLYERSGFRAGWAGQAHLPDPSLNYRLQLSWSRGYRKGLAGAVALHADEFGLDEAAVIRQEHQAAIARGDAAVAEELTIELARIARDARP